MNLVTTYVQQRLGEGLTKADILRELSRECGVSYTHSRINEMMRGDIYPSPPVRRYMLSVVIPDRGDDLV